MKTRIYATMTPTGANITAAVSKREAAARLGVKITEVYIY